MPAKTSQHGVLLNCPTFPRWENDLVGCGSSNICDEDDEGIIDCLNCGLFFKRAASLEGRYHCPAILSREPLQICGSTKLLLRRCEKFFDCRDCNAVICYEDALRSAALA